MVIEMSFIKEAIERNEVEKFLKKEVIRIVK